MEPQERVPMRMPRAGWLSDEDVRIEAAASTPIGRRLSMVVSEGALVQMGAGALQAAVEELGRRFAYLNEPEIRMAVSEKLRDRDWLAGILEDELRRLARAMFRDLIEERKLNPEGLDPERPR